MSLINVTDQLEAMEEEKRNVFGVQVEDDQLDDIEDLDDQAEDQLDDIEDLDIQPDPEEVARPDQFEVKQGEMHRRAAPAISSGEGDTAMDAVKETLQ